MTAPFYMALPHVAAAAFDDAATIGKRLPASLVYLLLAGLADRSLRPVDPQPFPTIGTVARHVQWSHTGIADLLTKPEKWLHPDWHKAWIAYWSATSKARAPKASLATDLPHACESLATDLQPDAGTTKALDEKLSRRFPGTFKPVSVRLIRALRLDARARSDHQTVIPSEDKKKHAPAPAVADLFASLDSQTSADTGKAAGDATQPPGVAAPLPVKAKRSKRGPSPEAVAAWPVALAWWAKVKPENAARLKIDKGDGLRLLEALDKQGVDVIVGRLRQAAVGTGYMARQVRGEVPGKDPVDGLPALLRERNGITTPLDSAAEAEGYGVPMDPSAPDPRALAVEAWANMMLDPRWKRITIEPPNRPGDFGQPSRWDLAETADEHDRRMTAFLRAGSIPKWRDADAQGRHDFRERWIGFYMDEVKA